MSRSAPDTCAVCGADIPRDARACPECGADERTGWSGQDAADGLDLPEEEFDHDRFAEREFGPGPPRNGLPRLWWLTALAVVALIVVLALLGVK